MNEGSSENVYRGSERRAVRVSLTFEDFRSFITQYASHVSMGGMFIGTRTPLPPGTLCKLDVRLKSGDSLIGGLGEVVWTRDRPQGPERPPGMGVRFRELEDSSRDLVFAIVDRRLVEGGHVFRLDENGEEEIPDLDELLQRAELHRQEAEDRVAGPETDFDEGDIPTGEIPSHDLEPHSKPILPSAAAADASPQSSGTSADRELEAMLASVESESLRRTARVEVPAGSSREEGEAAPPAEGLAEEALPSIHAEPSGGAGENKETRTSILPDVPDFDEEPFEDGEVEDDGFESQDSDDREDLPGTDLENPEEATSEVFDPDRTEVSSAVFDERDFEEDDLEGANLDELTSSVTTIDELERREGRDSEGTEEVDFGDSKQQLLTELYPGLAQRMEAEGLGEDGPPQSTEEVLVSLEKPISGGADLDQEPGAGIDDEPSPNQEVLDGAASAAGFRERTQDALDARLRGIEELMPPLEKEAPTAQAVAESRVFRAPSPEEGFEVATAVAAAETFPPPMQEVARPVEDSWSSYPGAPSSGSRRIFWLIPLLAVLLGGGYYFWQGQRGTALLETGQPPEPMAQAPGPAATPPEVASDDAAESLEPAPAITPQDDSSQPASMELEPPLPDEAPSSTSLASTPVPPPETAPPSPPEISPSRSTPSEPLPQSMGPMTSLLDISWQEVEEGTLVTLTADGAIESGRYKYARIGSGEPRLLVRLIGVRKDPRRGTSSVSTPEVHRIRTGYHAKPGGNEVHIVLDLAGPTVDAIRVEPHGQELRIWLSKVP